MCRFCKGTVNAIIILRLISFFSLTRRPSFPSQRGRDCDPGTRNWHPDPRTDRSTTDWEMSGELQGPGLFHYGDSYAPPPLTAAFAAVCWSFNFLPTGRELPRGARSRHRKSHSPRFRVPVSRRHFKISSAKTMGATGGIEGVKGT